MRVKGKEMAPKEDVELFEISNVNNKRHAGFEEINRIYLLVTSWIAYASR